jgi:diguanylate cyclase (GGDEF)-like protein
MKNIWSSLQFKIPTVFIVSFLLILIVVFVVFSTVGIQQLERQAYKQVALSGQNIVAELGKRIATAESLAKSLANLGEKAPRDVTQNKQLFRHVLDVEDSEMFIAGGGIWPAPYQYDPKIERRSFFWGRDANGVLKYYDDYNNPDGPGYHNEEWYVPAKHLANGKAFWSKSYMDPYSYQPMVTVTVPMYIKNKFYGVSTVDLKLEGLKAFLDKVTSSYGGYAFAVDRNGKFLSFPDEKRTKVFDVDSMGGRTENFITVTELHRQEQAFGPLAKAVTNAIDNMIWKTKRMGLFDQALSKSIADDSYQIDNKEADLIAAAIADLKQQADSSEVTYHEFFIENDMLLNESAYAAVFEMPETYWKVVTVMPYSKAIEASNVIYRNLVIYISLAMLFSLVLTLFVVRRVLVQPISGMSRQLKTLAESEKAYDKRLETDDKGELGMLAYWFNQRSDRLLEVQKELRETQNELEQRVVERTKDLRHEIEHRVAEQARKEQWAKRVEKQHAAIVELSIHQALFSGDIKQAAKLITRKAASVLDVARASIWLLDDNKEFLHVVDLYNSESGTHIDDLSLCVDSHPAYFNALENNRSIDVYNMFTDIRTAELHDYAKTQNISSLLDISIRVAGQLRGVICFEHIGEHRHWEHDEIRFGGEVADQFQQVLTNQERIETTNQIRQLAFYDPLTKLANRRLLQEKIQHEMEVARRHNVYGSLIYLDLDNFKTLNDSLGHFVGDELLVQLSCRLRETLRKEDTAARLGGDEFVVLLTGENRSIEDARRQALTVAGKLQESISESYRLHGYEHIITASMGITFYPDDGLEVDDLLKHADAAMYNAKDLGRNKICIYSDELQKVADNRLSLEKELRTAIRDQEFEMYYQPQVDTDGKPVGSEALIRWNHHDKGVVAPSDFIPIAEETGLILDIGDWVLHDVCEFSKKSDLSHLAINISPRQFHQPDFVEHVSDIITSSGAEADKLMIEITEGVVIDDIEDTIRKMNILKDMGIRFSMDDFGTGYSSLAYLKQLPLDQLKINDKFVRDINKSSSDAIIVETIIIMARHLGLSVVAEGVETEKQFQFLTEKGCQMFQGYYFSHPLNKTGISEYLHGSDKILKGT